MATITRFEDLKIWQSSRELNIRMHNIFKGRDDKNRGYLINHIFKTAGSVMDNIAEGFERGGNKEFRNFLSISKASAGELRSQLYRAMDFEIITQNECEEMVNTTFMISNQIGSLMRHIKSSDFKGAKFKEPEVDYGK